MASCEVKEETDCLDNLMSPIQPESNIYKITYPEKMDKDIKGEFKHETMRQYTETLICDTNAKGRITDLVFFTPFTNKWYKVFCDHYKSHTEEPRTYAKILHVIKDQDPKYLTIHICDNGTVMLQGKQERLIDFGKIFFNLRDKASSDDAKNESSDNRGKITSHLHITKSSKCQSDKSRGIQSHEDNTSNLKEEGDNEISEENSLAQAEPSVMQSQRDGAGC